MESKNCNFDIPHKSNKIKSKPLSYDEDYKKSIENPVKFFKSQWKELSWISGPSFPQSIKSEEGFERPKFVSGTLNACYNCIDRHSPSKILLTYESNNGSLSQFTRNDLLNRILRYCNFLKNRSDFAITLFLPMSPDTFCATLAASRLGIPHSVVFSGYSELSLYKRIIDSKSTLLITSDFYMRGNKKHEMWPIVQNVKNQLKEENILIDILLVDEESRKEFENKHIIFNSPDSFDDYTNKTLNTPSNIYKFKECKDESYIKPKEVDSEHPLFYLYTSGSTGNPKGIVHGTAGYLLYSLFTLKRLFLDPLKQITDLTTFYCTADLGWITGHTYSLYGPLLLGLNTVISSGLPTEPVGKIYRTINLTKASVFYTAPTVIRLLKKQDNNLKISKYSFDKLEVLGSVGEPLDSDARKWYSEKFSAPVVDTYWQTETGGVILAPLLSENKKNMVPLYGINPIIMRHMNKEESKNFYSQKGIFKEMKLEVFDEKYKKYKGENLLVISTGNTLFINCKEGELGYVTLISAWPGISQTILNDHSKYLEVYFKFIPSLYFTGDEGYYENINGINSYVIRGRADDVLNISAHRMSTGEIEDIILRHPYINECAAIGHPDPISGEHLILFVSVSEKSDSLKEELNKLLREGIGPILQLKKLYIVTQLPKTRTGKLMRRTLRALLRGEDVGDVSTCLNPESLEEIAESIK